MTTRVQITYDLLTSTHCGYCSGDECDLQVTEGVVCFANATEADLAHLADIDYWQKFLPDYTKSVEGKCCCCTLSPDAKEAGLDIHDYKTKITAVAQVL